MAGFIGQGLFMRDFITRATLSGTLTDTNLATWLAANTAWDGSVYIDTVVTLDTSARLKASSISNYGLRIASADFPGGAKIVIVMASGSRVLGYGGAAGSGGPAGTNGTSGGAGGPAIYCDMGTDVEFQNTNGEIAGGGGGGGGGGGAYAINGGSASEAAGGNGGTGAGAQNDGVAGSGVSGTSDASGDGSSVTSGDGGDGGALGAGGVSGDAGTGSPNQLLGSGGGGGAAGKAINLNGASSPTMATTSSPAVKGAIS